ncbi:hypothetical protein [Nonomuraea basaltis]|uniref:hypothetical protein n=1 Tax=Nonomuraea basaltis TaxID=2495887 RepID=UPI00110C5D13|nr:hypothetical protein [Nonomuraea basaltis]TMR93521.1 hypothetical protein EJK15_38930 [Nonomuraea basaltis]
MGRLVSASRAAGCSSRRSLWRRSWMSLIAVLIAVGGCAAEPTVSLPSGGPTPSPDVLLEPGQLTGSWTEAKTGDGSWASLEDDLVPCSRRAIAPGHAPVRFRVFRAADGASVSQLVVSEVDGMDSFKRFYAECLAVGEVESKTGPSHVARYAEELEIAAFTEDRLMVISGPVSRDDLRRIADIARRHLTGGS